MAHSYQYQLGRALSEVRKQLGYPSTYAACVAQKHLTLDQYRNREKGRSALSVEDLIQLAKDWGMSPAELFCLLSEAMEDDSFAAIALKSGLTTREARKRFKAKQLQLGMTFEQLFLLVSKDQVRL